MPAPTRARLADIGLQGLNPKKDYKKTGKDGLLLHENKENIAEITDSTTDKKNLVKEIEAKIVVEEKIDLSTGAEAPTETIAEAVVENLPLAAVESAVEQEEKKENKSFKKPVKKSFTP